MVNLNMIDTIGSGIKKYVSDIMTVIAIDKVQKKDPLTEAERKLLRDQNLIEGRYPNIFVVAQVAAATGDKASYIKNRAFNNDYYK